MDWKLGLQLIQADFLICTCLQPGFHTLIKDFHTLVKDSLKQGVKAWPGYKKTPNSSSSISSTETILLCTTTLSQLAMSNKGGRPKDPIWDSFVITAGKAQCNHCFSMISKKADRMKAHLIKCLKAKQVKLFSNLNQL